MCYRIQVTRSGIGNFTFDIFSIQGKKIATAPHMFTRKENCMEIANKLAKSLKCKIDFIDLEKDYEE